MNTSSPEHNLFLSEVFSSYQGEGIFVGMPQIFVRFTLCHMRCHYCDSPQTFHKTNTASIEMAPYSGIVKHVPNPISIRSAIELIRQLSQKAACHSITFTGGEPLLQLEALATLANESKNTLNLTTFLETSGTLPHLLEKTIPYIDIYSLDIKPPSCAGVKSSWPEIEACISIAAQKELVVKIVITDNSPTDTELSEITRICLKYKFPPVMTLVTKTNSSTHVPSGKRIQQIRNFFERSGVQAAFVPQIHRLANWL